jgi:hypothetical protein
LVTGDFVGKIKLYEMDDFTLSIEINAHARLVTGLDVHVFYIY